MKSFEEKYTIALSIEFILFEIFERMNQIFKKISFTVFYLKCNNLMENASNLKRDTFSIVFLYQLLDYQRKNVI